MDRLRQLVTAKNLKGDILGGVTTAIVSLPLALAFGVASGAGAEAGLYGAVLVGFWAALLGGTNTLISEPTGPMTLMMTTILTGLVAANPEHGLAIGFTVVVLAGFFQVILGLLKLGRYITLMPYAVVSGFMSGIGVLLIVLQLGPLLGQPTPPGGSIGVFKALPAMLEQAKLPELMLGGLSLLILFLQPASWRRVMPAQLVVLLVGVVYAWTFFDGEDLRTIGAIPAGLPSLRLPEFSALLAGQIIVDALLLAMLGCIDTLLTAVISDSLTRNRHDSNRELVGQGFANMISGLFGGLPGAGATMGTVVNIQTGGTTPRAGMIRALVLLLVVLVAAPLMEDVPMVILAAITFKVGVDILDWSFLRRIHHVSTTSTVIMYGVLVLTVMVDIMVAVGIGVFIANLLTIDRLSRLQAAQVRTLDPSDHDLPLKPAERALLRDAGGAIQMFHLSGPMIFGVANAIAQEQTVLKGAKALVVDLHDVPYLSVTVALAIENLIRDAFAAGCRTIVTGGNPTVRHRLEKLEMGDSTGVQFTDTREHALRLARALAGLPG